MARFDEHDLPDELREVEELLRRSRATHTELELDQLKRRAMGQAAKAKPSIAGLRKGMPVRSRLTALGVTLLLIGGSTAGAIASGSSGSTSSAGAQYCKKNLLNPACVKHGP
jgi:hypothetical protein